jgi:ribose/xylose/arabinose/galactoside ABC-type transport system permease subunit
MTYSEDRSSRFVGEGFRVEPEFRQASGSPEGLPEDPGESEFVPSSMLELPAPTPTAAQRAVTLAELDGAFDDPDHGEPGRDRLRIHLIWEIVLLLAGVGMAFAVIHTHGGSLKGANLRSLMVTASIFGLLALGAGISIRAGAVNLAVGPILVLSGLYFGDHANGGFYSAAGIAIVIAVVCGLAIALVVTVFHVPAWAASLGAYFGVLVWCTHLPTTVVLTTTYDPAHQGYYWFGGFALIAVIGAILGAVRPIRRALARFRPISDPADRRGVPAAVVAALAIVGSSLLAGVAGIALTMQQNSMTASDGLNFTGIAIGIVLLGGTSAFGRRGGILGTVLATGVFALAIHYVTLREWRGGEITVIAVALGVGVLVTRMVETASRPRHGAPVDDPEVSLSWLGRQQGSWAGQQRIRTAEDPTWVDANDERWGAR